MALKEMGLPVFDELLIDIKLTSDLYVRMIQTSLVSLFFLSVPCREVYTFCSSLVLMAV